MQTVETVRAAPGRNATTASPEAVDLRRLAVLAGSLLLLALPAILLRGTIPAAAALHALSGPDAPWIPGQAAGLVVVAAPLAAIGAIVLLLAPGLLLALACNRGSSAESWVLDGFALSLVSVSAAAGLAQAVAGAPLTGGAFAATVLLLAGAALGIVLLRLRMGATLRWPLAAPHAHTTLAGMLIVPFAILVALAPKFYWEAFNGDGAHAYEASRLLLDRAVPFFAEGSGEIRGFPGTTSFLFAYPTSWFIRLFGGLEVSARLPLLLFLPPLFGGIVAVINRRNGGMVDRLVANAESRDGGSGGDLQVAPAAARDDAGLGSAERWLIWLALAVYVVVIAFSATYSPYSADIALPATQDTLLVVGFLGYVLAFLRRSWGWTAAYALITYTSLPNGLLLLGFWLVAWFLVNRPLPWRDTVRGGAIVFGCMVAGALLPRLIAAAGGPVPGGEYGLGGLLVRFAFLQLTDWTRLAYIVVPCGIVPAIALLFWRRQDTIARAMTLVTAAYFLFAFVQAHAPLHYYIPAMVLPLVVFWRTDPAAGPRRVPILATTAAAALLALVLSWPAEPGPFTASREVGRSIEIRYAGYADFEPETLHAADLLWRLIPYDWSPAVPDSAFGGSPIVFQYYAHTRSTADGEPNAIVQRLDDAPPPGAQAVADDRQGVIYVRDTATWRNQLALRPATPAGAPIYQEPRGILFRSVPLVGGPRIIDLPAIAERLGIDVDALAGRLGVER
jgi:hypothetical protein